LVVDCDEPPRIAAKKLCLDSTRQLFDYASSLVEAVEFLKANNYVCVFLASEIPAMPGAPPRRQDTENLMDELDRIKGYLKPPVVCMWHEMPDMNLENFICWAGDMSLKGVVKWVKKPLASGGSTLGRMVKDILNGQYVRLIKATPLTPNELMASPLQVGQDQLAGTRDQERSLDDQAGTYVRIMPRLDFHCLTDGIGGAGATSNQ
jgi:hypothetical protein